MDNQHNPLLNWAYFCQGKSMDELRQSLLLTALELENIRIKAQEELKMRDDELVQLKDLLNRTIKERDEAHEKSQRLLFEKLLLQQQQHLQQLQHQAAPVSGVSSIEDEPRRGMDSSKSSSDCDESIVSSPVVDAVPPQHMPPALPQIPPAEQELSLPIVLTKPLPEKGKLLQAVMKAGPLLQTLLLAGPLPQWRHPPPPFDSHQIPPPPVGISSSPPPPPPILTIPSLHEDSLFNLATCSNSINNCGRLHKKRGFNDDSDSFNEAKYQRVVLQ